MKISLAQYNFQAGNFESNKLKIINAIQIARREGADLVVFSELCICGYPARDFLTYPHFIQKSIETIEQILPFTDNIAVAIGAPSINPLKEGKDLFNSAWILADRKVLSIVHKTLLPTYDVFDEYRYFEPNFTFNCVEWRGKKIAVTVCEDIWNVGNDNPLYRTCPMDELINQKPDFIINLSASPFSYVQHEERIKILTANVKRYKIPLIYVNQIGAQTEILFDGDSMAMNKNGEIIAHLPQFQESQITLNLLDDKLYKNIIVTETSQIHDALIMGIKDYFSKLSFKKAILGLSGGIDSALVLYLATKALGAENVLSVLLPSRYSSNHSIDDSIHLCKNLNSEFHIVEIEKGFQSFLDILNPYFKELPSNVAEENIQARVRAILLMAFSNKFGYILLNTTNKSEAAVGYGTLYGDMCGGIAVLGDVYKTQVYELARFINRNEEIIPKHIIEKAPSAELRPGQKDSDSLPDYAILDKILKHYIEDCKGPDEIISIGFESTLVYRVLKMVNMNEWKRYQTPPILRVSPKAFGMGRRMPIEGKYLS